MQTLIFLRGVSGSGKSTFAKFLVGLGNAIDVTADTFFLDEQGEYVFDEKKLGAAHRWCIEQVEAAFVTHDTVIVHNTSIDGISVRLYQNVAEKVGAKFVSLIVENRHGNINTHEVPVERVEAQALKLLNNIQLTPHHLDYGASKSKPKDPSKLEIVEFLKKYASLDIGLRDLHNDYGIFSRKLNGKLLLKYDTFADKKPQIVRECRGIILNASTFEVLSLPLEKFGNYGESYTAAIDMATAKVVEKLDGTCTILYWDSLNKKWCVQTLGQIEAEETVNGWTSGQPGLTWADLFWNTFKLYAQPDELLPKLNKDLCYVFEMCTPWNRVVIEHKEPRLYFTAARNKKTLQEVWPDQCTEIYNRFHKPRLFPYNDVKEIVRICKEELTKDDEGFILIDSNFNRSKFKSVSYVLEHYQCTVVTANSICGVIFQGETEEYLAMFPEYTEVVNIINNELDRVGSEIDNLYIELKSKMIDPTSAREFSQLIKPIKNRYYTGFLFSIFNGHIKNGKEGIMEYDKYEWMVHKVREFLAHSNVANLLNANKSNKSLK